MSDEQKSTDESKSLEVSHRNLWEGKFLAGISMALAAILIFALAGWMFHVVTAENRQAIDELRKRDDKILAAIEKSLVRIDAKLGLIQTNLEDLRRAK
jgi:hypothetical protein